MRSLPKNAATLQDVARQAGVSKVTASAVLNGSRSNTRVSEPTRQRVQEVAARLSYRPNAVARSLRRRRTDIIGFYTGHNIANARNIFLAEIIGGLQNGCEEHHKDLLLYGLFRGQSVEDIYTKLADGSIDGLVLIGFPDDPLIDRLAASSLPAVAIADAVPALPSVVVDDDGGSRLLANYLYEKGHRRVLYRECPQPRSSGLRRFSAFNEAARGLGMTVLTGPPADFPGGLTDWEVASLTRPSARRPTALACWNDGFADHAYAACRAIGLRVPKDLAIVGFNGIVPPVAPAYQLTTIRAPWAEVASTAVSVLADKIEGKEVAQETTLPVELAEGDTA